MLYFGYAMRTWWKYRKNKVPRFALPPFMNIFFVFPSRTQRESPNEKKTTKIIVVYEGKGRKRKEYRGKFIVIYIKKRVYGWNNDKKNSTQETRHPQAQNKEIEMFVFSSEEKRWEEGIKIGAVNKKK